jgi:hypothetical protein
VKAVRQSRGGERIGDLISPTQRQPLAKAERAAATNCSGKLPKRVSITPFGANEDNKRGGSWGTAQTS